MRFEHTGHVAMMVFLFLATRYYLLAAASILSWYMVGLACTTIVFEMRYVEQSIECTRL